MKILRVFLFILIIIGLGALASEKLWVPSLVAQILIHENTTPVTKSNNETLPTPASTTTTTTTTTTVTSTGTTTRPGKIATGVEGIVTIGPTCPVEKIPADPACANKPYETTLVIASTIMGRQGGVLVRTDSKGYFSLEMTPGTYTLRAQSTAKIPNLAQILFTVTAGKLTSLNPVFDSGIR